MDWCGQRSDTSSKGPAGSTHNRHTPNQRGGFSLPGGPPPMQGFPVSLFHLLLDFKTHMFLIVNVLLAWLDSISLYGYWEDGFIFLFQSQFPFPGLPSFTNFTGPLPHPSVSLYLFKWVNMGLSYSLYIHVL